MQKETLGDGIIGHTAVIRLLESWSAHPANGYAFVGPSHIGKRTIAERFACVLLSREGDDAVAPDRLRAHPDFVILEPAEGKTTITVDQVREARTMMSTSPLVASRRVCLIPSADRMNDNGWNALLKILEEPPAGAVFIFVAESATAFPLTVRSRVTVIPLDRVGIGEIERGLIERGIKSNEAKQRAIASRGRPGLAIEEASRHPSVLSLLTASSLGERLQAIDALSASCESTEDNRSAWRSALDDLAVALSDRLATDPTASLVFGEALATSWRFVGGPISPRIPLEAACVRLSGAQPIDRLFPSHLPTALPRIFSSVE